jgi:hypothetical protein
MSIAEGQEPSLVNEAGSTSIPNPELFMAAMFCMRKLVLSTNR